MKAPSPIVPASWERQVRQTLLRKMRHIRGGYILSWQGKGYVGDDPKTVCDQAIADMNKAKPTRKKTP